MLLFCQLCGWEGSGQVWQGGPGQGVTRWTSGQVWQGGPGDTCGRLSIEAAVRSEAVFFSGNSRVGWLCKFWGESIFATTWINSDVYIAFGCSGGSNQNIFSEERERCIVMRSGGSLSIFTALQLILWLPCPMEIKAATLQDRNFLQVIIWLWIKLEFWIQLSLLLNYWQCVLLMPLRLR